MSDQPVTLYLPDDLYEQIQQVAEASDRSVENVLLESLNLLFKEGTAAFRDLSELAGYSDEQLWAVVHRRLPWVKSMRLRELTTLSKQSELTPEQETELEQLLSLNDQYMLFRSESLRILRQRGHDVDLFLETART